MKSKLTLLMCIVVLLGGYVWGADKYIELQDEYRYYVKHAPSKIMYDKYKNDSKKLDNVLRYMREKMHTSDANIILSQAYEK